MYIKKVFLWAALGLTATATLTSCEDILGHWEKPTPAVPASAVEDARVLGAALEAGATVSVNYTVGSTGYVATFQKNADDTYTLLSNTAAAAGARATTRMIASPDYTVPVGDAATGNVLLQLVGDKLVFTVKTADGAPIFKAEMNVKGGEVTVVNTNGGGQDCTIGQVSVGDQAKAIVNPEMQAVNISNDYGSVKYAVKYSEGETWADVVKRYEGVDVVKITTSDDDDRITVKFSKDFIVATLMATREYTNETAESRYNNDYASTFYLTAQAPSDSRAGTRGSTPTPTFIKATDEVGDAATYYLTQVITNLSTTPAHTAQDGEILTGTLGNNVQISIADGATVTLNGVSINAEGNWTDGNYAGITCEGDATIILKGTNTVKGFYNEYPGIYVPENKTLTIQGTGRLTASGNKTSGPEGDTGWGAGIGGGLNVNCGNIVIKGGNITANGGPKNVAGIGGGNQGSCGYITISGGTVTATGGRSGAGIGGGHSGSCGAITISGGTVTATGGDSGAGIGSGNNNTCGAIIISGGNVTAEGGSDGAGIGSGQSGRCGAITISGGTVEATGGSNGAGIGGGAFNGECGTITITSGVASVKATKNGSAPYSIGNGYNSTNAISVKIGDETPTSGISESPYTYQTVN